uniref:Uncharacterized protein n=1 Tax=Knipowitschia caucasica TaxID=637954 RepID=A0AAV2KTS8_KNICA
MSKVAEPWSARQQRQLAFISEYTTDIRHIAGKSNVVADCLSRAVVGAVQLGLDYARMGADQAAPFSPSRTRTLDCSWERSRSAFLGSGCGVTSLPASPGLWSPPTGSGLFLRLYTACPILAERHL